MHLLPQLLPTLSNIISSANDRKRRKKTKLNNYTLHQNETESINRLKRSLNARPIYQITSISTVQQIEQASNITKSIRTTEKA